MERLFKQFDVTYITLQVAVALAGGDSTALKTLAQDGNGEMLLSTGAKLIYIQQLNTFAVWSYHYAGKDGYNAVVNALGGDNPRNYYDILNIDVYDATHHHALDLTRTLLFSMEDDQF